MTLRELEDIACLLARLAQIDKECAPDHFVWHRIITCDVPRLRAMLSPHILELLDDVTG